MSSSEGMVSLNAIMRPREASIDSMKKITSLAESAKSGERYIEELKEKLKAWEHRLNEIVTIELPTAMMEAGMKEFTLHTGEKIEVKNIVSAKIPTAYQEQAFAWLEEHGHGDLIKSEISVTFGREQNEDAKKIMEELTARGLNASQSKGVHYQTLSSFVREQMAVGREIPMETLGVYTGQKATIKNVKQPTKGKANVN